MSIGFDGSSDFAKFVGSPAFALTGDTDKFTMAGWMRIKNITPGQYSYPFGIESADTDSSDYALIGYTNLDVAQFTWGGSYNWSPAPVKGNWYYFYISGANDGIDGVDFNAGYYDIESTTPIDSTADNVATEFDVVRICVGNNSWSEWLEVDLSQVRVWTGIELSNAQLLAERNSTKAVYTTGLFADWPMTHSTYLSDISGNGRTLSTGGTLTTQDEPPNNPSDTVTLFRGGWRFSNPVNTQFRLNDQSPQSKGLVAWWPLEHGGNTSHQDRIGQGGLMNVKEPHASFSRMVVDADHGWVYEYNYDGSTDAGLQIASNSPPLTGVSRLTASIWVKTDWSVYVSTEYPYFFAKSGWSDNREWRIRYEDGTDVVRFHVSHNGTDTYAATLSSVSSTVDTGWHHWVGTYDTNGGSGNVKLYLDGVEVGTPDTTTGALYSGTLPVSIGASGDAIQNAATRVEGRLKDARIYDRALSAAEVQDLYVNPWDLYRPVFSRPLPLAGVGGFEPILASTKRKFKHMIVR